MERDLFQGAISAVSNPFYAIDATCHKIRMAIAASIALYRNDAAADGETVSAFLAGRGFDDPQVWWDRAGAGDYQTLLRNIGWGSLSLFSHN